MDITTTKALIVDDDEDDAMIVAGLLAEAEQSYITEWIADYSEAESRLNNGCDWDVALVDYRLGPHDGLELLAAHHDQGGRVPIILLTGLDDQMIDTAALEAGAADYLRKGQINGELLDRSIRYAIEHRRAQQMVANTLLRVEALLDAIPDLMFRVDRDGRYLDHHIGGASAPYVPPESFLGRTMRDVLPTGVADACMATLAEAVATGRVASLEYQLEMEGVTRDYEARMVPVPDSAEVIIIARDNTAQRSTERALAEAQKLEAIGTLAAGVAHEINTPVQYIGDNLRFLEQGTKELLNSLEADQAAAGSPDTGTAANRSGAPNPIDSSDLEFYIDEMPDAIQQSLEGVEQVATIVRALKDFSRRDTETLAPVDINRALASTITVARSEWKYVAEVHTDLDPDLPLVQGALGRLNQVFLNLLVNAAHAIEDVVGSNSGARGRITVQTRGVGDMVEISISDTGCGIPDEIRARIFDPFFTTKEVGQGTGQGLSIAHAVVVEQHNGELEVTTEPGRGTTFVVRLPLEQSVADVAAPHIRT